MKIMDQRTDFKSNKFFKGHTKLLCAYTLVGYSTATVIKCHMRKCNKVSHGQS